jgi:DNA-binding IscR family transcriptional regulator
VIRTIDGPIFLTSCFTEHGMCSHSERCNVREPLRKVHEGILKLLANITIGDMSQDDAELDSPASGLFALQALTPPRILRNETT